MYSVTYKTAANKPTIWRTNKRQYASLFCTSHPCSFDLLILPDSLGQDGKNCTTQVNDCATLLKQNFGINCSCTQYYRSEKSSRFYCCTAQRFSFVFTLLYNTFFYPKIRNKVRIIEDETCLTQVLQENLSVLCQRTNHKTLSPYHLFHF